MWQRFYQVTLLAVVKIVHTVLSSGTCLCHQTLITRHMVKNGHSHSSKIFRILCIRSILVERSKVEIWTMRSHYFKHHRQASVYYNHGARERSFRTNQSKALLFRREDKKIGKQLKLSEALPTYAGGILLVKFRSERKIFSESQASLLAQSYIPANVFLLLFPGGPLIGKKDKAVHLGFLECGEDAQNGVNLLGFKPVSRTRIHLNYFRSHQVRARIDDLQRITSEV